MDGNWHIVKCIFLFFFFTLLLGNEVVAQLTIQSIHLEDLKKTKEEYINRFIDSEIGNAFNLETLKKDLQRLKNLNGIADATFTIDTTGTGVNIRFQLKEALTLFPIINFGGVKGNFWYQLGFNDDNWMGRGQKITAFYQNNDRRHNYNIYYKIPQFRRSRWGGSFSAFKWASVEPLFFEDATVFYDYDNFSLGLSSIFEIKRNSKVELGLTYFIEDYAKNDRHDGTFTPGPEELRQPKLLTKLIHYQNAISYHFFYLSGMDNVASLQTVHNFYDKSWFHIFLNDTRYFKRFGNLGNLAARLRLGIATNNNTPFAPFVLDSYINIRGSGNRIERGTAALILNLEYRQTVFESAKFAGQVVAFSDTGSWRNPGGSLEDLVNENSIQYFVGGGIRFIYKLAFNAIFRIDYGLDMKDFDRRGLVVGIGQYF